VNSAFIKLFFEMMSNLIARRYTPQPSYITARVCVGTLYALLHELNEFAYTQDCLVATSFSLQCPIPSGRLCQVNFYSHTCRPSCAV